jgi:hypothetical protein
MSWSPAQRFMGMSLVRKMMRDARHIPSYNHQRVALHKIRVMVEQAVDDGPEKLDENLMLADIYHDTIKNQLDHLQKMQSEGLLVESFDWMARRRAQMAKRRQKEEATHASAHTCCDDHKHSHS